MSKVSGSLILARKLAGTVRTVNVSERPQGKQVGRRIRILQFVRGRTVDGDRSAGGLIRKVSS
jgi:hypothetical protein